MSTETLTLEMEGSPKKFMALAQFIKRTTWSQYEENAVNEAEAYEIRSAVIDLARAGYNPR